MPPADISDISSLVEDTVQTRRRVLRAHVQDFGVYVQLAQRVADRTGILNLQHNMELAEGASWERVLPQRARTEFMYSFFEGINAAAVANTGRILGVNGVFKVRVCTLPIHSIVCAGRRRGPSSFLSQALVLMCQSGYWSKLGPGLHPEEIVESVLEFGPMVLVHRFSVKQEGGWAGGRCGILRGGLGADQVI